jgi:hypothetical protein
MSVIFTPPVEEQSIEIPTAVLDEDAVRMVLWFFGRPGGVQPGGFWSAQLEAFAVADMENFRRLYEAFPVHAFWFDALKRRSNGVTLAVRALDLLGVKA